MINEKAASKKIIIIIILIYLLTLIPTYLFLLNLMKKGSNENDELEFTIYIHSNEDFENYGFPGNGTLENPYRIENYTIITSKEVAIYITNVSKHFLIQNNVLKAKEKAIWIYHISANITRIERNICYGNRDGIIVYYAQGSYIFNNTCFDNLYEGIIITSYENLDSDYSIIANNSCYRNGGPNILVYNSSHIVIENNSLHFDITGYLSRAGLAIYNSLYTTIQNNYLENCGFSIYFDKSKNYETLSLIKNKLNGENYEFGCFFDSQNLSLSNCEYDQVHFDNCTSVKISNSSFSLTNFGIKLNQCFNVTIENCSFNNIGSEGGIHMVDLENAIILNNTFLNSYYGLDSYTCNDIEISNNSIEKNLDGFRLNYSNITLNYNLFIENHHGCYMFGCGYEPNVKINDKTVNYNCTLYQNQFVINEIAVKVFTSNCLILNNSFDYNDLGLNIIGWDAIAYLLYSNCSIVNNEFINNFIGCKMELAISELKNNYIACNNIGLHILDSLYQLISNLFENNGEDIIIE